MTKFEEELFSKFQTLTTDELCQIYGGSMAKNIKTGRVNLGMSQVELAQKLFVSQQAVSQWESGKTYPNVASLLLLKDLYQISLEKLME
jgi:transcriptional regulator with XRE-family HTH domain